MFPFMANKEKGKETNLICSSWFSRNRTNGTYAIRPEGSVPSFSLMTFEHSSVPETQGMNLLRSPQEDGMDGLEKKITQMYLLYHSIIETVWTPDLPPASPGQ